MDQFDQAARRIHRMTTSGVSYETMGRAKAFGYVRTAAAGIALLLDISLEEAEQRLLDKVAPKATANT